MSITTKAIRIVYLLLVIISFLAGLIGTSWDSAPGPIKSIGVELISASILSIIFLAYDYLRDAANKEDQIALKDNIIETISSENRANQQYRFFLCTPITSCIEFDASGKIKPASYQLHKNIHQFSVDLQKRLRELGGGQVYYGLNINDDVFGNKGFPQDLTRTQFDLYLQKLQTRHVDALHSTEFFITFLPLEKRSTNSIFEAGVAAGRKIKSLYFYKTEGSLPPIMRKGVLNGRIKSVQEPDLEAKLSSYNSAGQADRDALIERFAYEINKYYQGKDFVG